MPRLNAPAMVVAASPQNLNVARSTGAVEMGLKSHCDGIPP